jgi:lactate racemase
LTSHQAPGLPDERAAILDALRNPINSAPLKDKVKAGETVSIFHTDITHHSRGDK